MDNLNCYYCNDVSYLLCKSPRETIEITRENKLVFDMKTDYAEININYCPICGRKLEES